MLSPSHATLILEPFLCCYENLYTFLYVILYQYKLVDDPPFPLLTYQSLSKLCINFSY